MVTGLDPLLSANPYFDHPLRYHKSKVTIDEDSNVPSKNDCPPKIVFVSDAVTTFFLGVTCN